MRGYHSYLCVIVVLCALGSVLTQKYTTKYDNVNLDDILNNYRLLKFYTDCLLETSKHCTPDAKELKENLPDALKTDCSKCSERQRAGSTRVINFLMDNKPDVWKQLETKYDPEGIYAARFEKRKGISSE